MTWSLHSLLPDWTRQTFQRPCDGLSLLWDHSSFPAGFIILRLDCIFIFLTEKFAPLFFYLPVVNHNPARKCFNRPEFKKTRFSGEKCPFRRVSPKLLRFLPQNLVHEQVDLRQWSLYWSRGEARRDPPSSTYLCHVNESVFFVIVIKEWMLTAEEGPVLVVKRGVDVFCSGPADRPASSKRV